ncbi:DddA-like double-stranded DNA deaminase toxin [Glycomyces paridis]|uniref:DddA-like double-stranded DNA deaminase toxin n=1 Tax=Glycomyces paridis TaxID=2126555 RepID=UPI001F004E34|nr:DddA-like double-stranded DNA deaminase toxin [Glycomyces paridis]
MDDISAALGVSRSEAEGLAGQLAVSKQQTEDLQAGIAALGAEASANRASAAARSIEGLMAEAARLAERISEVQAQVVAIGQSGLLSTGTGTPAQSAAPTGRARRLADFNPRRSHPEAVQEIRRVGYPRNAEGRTSARALVYTADGEQLNREPLKPHRKGEAPERPELHEPWASSEDMKTTWHVEGDAAAMIRKDRLQDAAFYLNVPLCGSRQGESELPDPEGCAENFRHVIPRDTVAYVHVVREGRVPYRQKITGTGEGIKE